MPQTPLWGYDSHYLLFLPSEPISFFKYPCIRHDYAKLLQRHCSSDSRSWHSHVCVPLPKCDITPKQSPALNLACRTHTAVSWRYPHPILGNTKGKTRCQIKCIRAKRSHWPEKGWIPNQNKSLGLGSPPVKMPTSGCIFSYYYHKKPPTKQEQDWKQSCAPSLTRIQVPLRDAFSNSSFSKSKHTPSEQVTRQQLSPAHVRLITCVDC